MVVHGETGLLVPPHDPPGLAESLRRLLADAPQRRRYGAAARTRAETEFNLALHASRLQAVYDGLPGARDGFSPHQA
jgi:glycosyltransferase involved in cell wall biosynthesis